MFMNNYNHIIKSKMKTVIRKTRLSAFSSLLPHVSACASVPRQEGGTHGLLNYYLVGPKVFTT